MRSMQIFVFVFDLLIALYYVYQMPVWDSIKSKFPFFQYDSKVVEEADCSSFLLSLLLVLLSKVSLIRFINIGTCTFDRYCDREPEYKEHFEYCN